MADRIKKIVLDLESRICVGYMRWPKKVKVPTWEPQNSMHSRIIIDTINNLTNTFITINRNRFCCQKIRKHKFYTFDKRKKGFDRINQSTIFIRSRDLSCWKFSSQRRFIQTTWLDQMHQIFSYRSYAAPKTLRFAST